MEFLLQDLTKTKLFKVLPTFQSLEYQGLAESGIQAYRGGYADKEVSLSVAHFIRREEDAVWKGCREMMEFAVKQAATLIQGFFGFDLLTVEFDESMRHFQVSHLTQLLVNHAKKMQPGDTRLIQYASLYGLFKKRIPESWGKIDFHVPVRLFPEEPTKLDLYIKKIRKASPDSVIIMNDLSAEPIFRFGEEEQTTRLSKLFHKECQTTTLPEIYMISKNQCVELGAQFGVRS